MCGCGIDKIASLWYNKFVRAVNLPDKTKFEEVIYGIYD